MSNFIKCVKCNREATFDSPEPLCDNHWAEWWAEEDNHEMSHDEAKKFKKETLQSIKRQYARGKK